MDQVDPRQDDGRSLIFDSPPPGGPLEILGAPIVSLDVAANRSTVSCSADAFLIEAELHADEGEERIFSRSWRKVIPRQLL